MRILARTTVRMLFISSSTKAFTLQAPASTRFAAASAAGIGPMSYNNGLIPSRRMMSQVPDGGADTTVVSTCQKKISDALETDKVTVTGAYDDPNGSHISIEVISEQFEGKRLMQRQQMVYKAIWEEMQGAVHAVDGMICKAPSEV
mmetsp:Transcript_21560/g.31573  ORF Transcript_21560/g.31573 Transcript_21560/m.31573 type:complete len:146 (-) Transcript_21560:203-640(-)|eukprot:CAMPEP_0195541162 /NCGR_PEP_ID=MMETSP0794_2-20130614/50944_1 /TAXON_ID=515487 /ORGANISM="Stephanopyxis turris, Strain CCMP 815" /LENGTH=145 /DNA_ID=CAMNT_0040675247 /DNA_START=90 /DNA_END=527 /DNA_ORIENTATION=-